MNEGASGLVEIRRDTAEAFGRLIIAREAIMDEILDKRGVFGAIACPVCKSGTLSFMMEADGVMHAGCSGWRCVRWFE